tara:strand:+ start:245 stop:679 length:435 start_codon:yes stop_codon:yes gene_type:complete
MKVILFLFSFIIFIYNCSPINKQHGYLLVDVVNSADKMMEFDIGTTKENDVFEVLGSPSIVISDINNIWIYLISVKRQNVFESDDIVYQSILRFEFDDSGYLKSKDFKNEEDFTEIQFAQEKTRVITDTYGLTEQIYESFTRGQ